jgi:hypothetical protein
VRCPDCGIKREKVEQLPSKAPFSKRFEEAIGEACESAPVRRVAFVRFSFKTLILVLPCPGGRSVNSPKMG